MNDILPVDVVLPALRDALRARSVAVLEAPPGAGKTTRVPLDLLDAPWLGSRRIVMLEPRRLAARNAAHFMARTLGERVGETIGYRVRGDTRVGQNTRVEIVTEGVLARLRSSDPALEAYGAVIFDEFHERSVHADLGLALVLETQQLVRPDLRVLVMSATLDGDAVAECIASDAGKAPVVRSSGRMFAIETLHRPPRDEERLEAHVSRVLREAIGDTEGDILVFLPGMGEQLRTRAVLHWLPGNVEVHLLHGTMSFEEQEAAILPAAHGRRKIVLATSIAETSLTIEGVRVVVDSGLTRLPHYSPRTGLSRLDTVRVSRASADQRRGRAGRVAPGWCYRLWDAHEDAMLVPQSRPEILDADLSSLALELADAGVGNASHLRWMDAPPAGALTQARDLLRRLGALNERGRITEHGRLMARVPVTPRLAHMLLVAQQRNALPLAALLSALLEERDIFRGERNEVPSSLQLRAELVAGQRTDWDAHAPIISGATVQQANLHRVRHQARDLLVRMSAAGTELNRTVANVADTGVLVACAYPDRVAQRRAGQDARFLLRNGTGARLPAHDVLAGSEYLAVAEMEGQPPEFRIVRAEAVSLPDVRELFGHEIRTTSVVEWDDSAKAVRAWKREVLDALVLSEQRANPSSEDATRAVVAMLKRVGADAWPWSASSQKLHERLAFLHHHDPSWPDVSSHALEGALDDVLQPMLSNVRTWSDLEQLDWHNALLARVPWSNRTRLDDLAPSHIVVPTGSRIPVDYTDVDAPVLAVRLQEVFGWLDTPRVMDGRVPLTLHLLSPAHRPVQVTRDLAGFWRTSYFDVRKEMRGRYPKHPWPEDPLSAQPTRRTKPRGE